MSRFLDELTAYIKSVNATVIRVSEYKDGIIDTVEFENANFR